MIKKTKILLLVVGTAIAAMFTTSCDEDLTSTPLSIDNLDSASVRIYPKANLDLRSAGNEAVPEGTVVTITIAYTQYSTVGIGGASNSSIVVSNAVNASGFVEFTVPVDDNGVNATVSVEGFEFEQVQADGSTKKSWYNFSPASYSLKLGGKNIYNVVVNTISAIDESTTLLPATLVGNVTAELNLQTAGNEAAPSGTVVVITKTEGNESFETETTLDANGQFSVEVMVNKDGTDEFEVTIRSFVTTQTQSAGTTPATKNVEFATKTVDYGSIAPGQTKIINTTLAAPTVVDGDPAIELVTISGIIYSEINEDQAIASRETLNNKAFTFFTLEDEGVAWSKEVTTSASGKYTVEVPVGQTVYLSCVLEMDRKLDSGELDDDLNIIYETTNWRLEVDMDDEFDVTGAVTFDQGGKDIGSETGADQFNSYWTEVVQP